MNAQSHHPSIADSGSWIVLALWILAVLLLGFVAISPAPAAGSGPVASASGLSSGPT